MAVFMGHPLQRGYGVGGFFKGLAALFRPLINLFRTPAVGKSIDILRKVSKKPIAKKLISQTKKELGKTAINVANDIIEGSSVKKSLKNHGLKALKNIGSEVLKKQSKVKKTDQKHKRGKKRKRSIFD